ncbi:MAG: GntR family transcriptional regulator [Kiritimatiellae bacterium]|jgi:GntR family transcriptional regulator|nr:GntR family transcriptional regulator [Kiritimatiellia bacterium]
MVPFKIELKAGIPIYEQVVYAVKKAVAFGRLVPGDRLPSVRNLSQDLKINPNTAQKAMSRLIHEKIVEVRPGIGCTVAAIPAAPAEQRAKILETKIEELVVDAKQLGMNAKELAQAVQKQWTK